METNTEKLKAKYTYTIAYSMSHASLIKSVNKLIQQGNEVAPGFAVDNGSYYQTMVKLNK